MLRAEAVRGGPQRPLRVDSEFWPIEFECRKGNAARLARECIMEPFEMDDDRLAFVVRLSRHPLALVPTTGTGEVTPEAA